MQPGLIIMLPSVENMLMKRSLIIFTICLMTFHYVRAQSSTGKFERSAYYAVMASGDLEKVDNELAVLNDALVNNKEGLAGALLMRKAGLVARPKDKLKFFKQGRIAMETALMADSTQTELRFLRLTIQEHAPKIVKYRADISRDKLYIRQHFKNLPQVVQKAILDYSKSSNVLHPTDL